jgi:hypothetical protein
MRATLKTLSLFLFIISFSGCNSDNKQQAEEFKKEISKRQSNTYEHFQLTNEKIDSTFDKKKLYVPVYSHVYISENKYVRLSITLSIRNSDLTKDLYIESIDYYNTEGKLVKQYLSQPHILKPMASMDYVVNLEDMSGGNGAKFLINTASKNKISNPIAQAIMINTLGNSNLSFVTQGYIIE